jgi:hypothetical protein
MLNARRSRSLPRHAATVVAAVAIVGASLSPVSPAAAAPPVASQSAIGAGMISDPVDYQRLALPADGDGDGEFEIEDPIRLGDDVCRQLAGEVSQADIDEALKGEPAPTEPGVWQYEVCAEDAASARDIAARYPTAAAARQHCEPEEGADICGVYIRWRPEIPPISPVDPGTPQDWLHSLLDFEPILKTSPQFDRDHGVIANLPTWFWNTVKTNFPKAAPGAGNAWHLWTTFRVNGLQVCRVAGLHMVGTPYHPDQDAPDKPSPSNCGYTFPNQGRYVVRGCTRWLFILGGGIFPPVVFAATFCTDDIVPVKESQILTGGDARRIPLPPR